MYFVYFIISQKKRLSNHTNIVKSFYNFRLFYIDYRYHFSSILKIGHQCDYRSNLLHIDRHADAAATRETNVRQFQVHSGKEVIHLCFQFFLFLRSLIIPIF